MIGCLYGKILCFPLSSLITKKIDSFLKSVNNIKASLDVISVSEMYVVRLDKK